MPQAIDQLLEGMQKHYRLHKLAISQTGFVFDPQTGKSFSVNHTALLTLELLKQGASCRDTAQRLSAEFKVPFEIAESSIEGFLLQLGRYLQ